MALTFTGPFGGGVSTSGGGGQAGMIATGTTRWNTTTNQMEVFNGYQWMSLGAEAVREVTLAEMVQTTEDQIATQIELDYADNATIQDAFKVWEEANERFRVILALVEKK